MKPSLLKGTRDFLPQEVMKRDYMFSVIRSVFQTYGYLPIETPTMEKLATLQGKTGEEGDKLLFKVLNNGDFLSGVDDELLISKNSLKVGAQISKRGLRYDLTVPMARFVVMHQNELSFPFKRYQIQRVWRADRPQKGRYQEFYQCDVDIIGSDSLMYEAELVHIYDDVFAKLDLEVEIRINNRKLLSALSALFGLQDSFAAFTVVIDKMDKIGMSGVRNELASFGMSESQLDDLEKILSMRKIEDLEEILGSQPDGQQGIEELKTVFSYVQDEKLSNALLLDMSLARGLDYYTGCVYEVTAKNVEMGSIGGGGRYDDLTSVFGMKGVSGVGVSFGAERIYDILDQLDKFPVGISESVLVLFASFNETHHKYAFALVQNLRSEGIPVDLYPAPVKLRKQLKYANDRQIPFVAIIGDEEISEGTVTLKNMEDGMQESVNIDQFMAFIRAKSQHIK